MSHQTLISYILFGCLMLGACRQRVQVKVDQGESISAIKPEQLVVYVDCSQSVKGFFHSPMQLRETPAQELMINLTGKAIRDSIPVQGFKFNETCELFSDSAEGLTQSIDASFFNCQENRYSVALKTMIDSMRNPRYQNAVFLIFSDGVPSISENNGSLATERADIMEVMSNFRRDYPEHGLGLFHYSVPYYGNYPLQPDHVKGVRTSVAYQFHKGGERNFFLLAFYPIRYQGYLNSLLDGPIKTQTHQHFHLPYSSSIDLKAHCSPSLVSDGELSLDLRADAPHISTEILEKGLEVWDEEKAAQLYPLIMFSPQGEGKWNVKLDFSESPSFSNQPLRIKWKIQDPATSHWDSLYYERVEFETKDNYNSTKTYRLDLLTKTFEQVYTNGYAYAAPVEFSTEGLSYPAFPYLWFLGEEADLAFHKRIYVFLFGAAVLVAILGGALFFLTGLFDSTINRTGSWQFVGLISALVCAIISLLVVWNTSPTNCSETFSFVKSSDYALINSGLCMLFYLFISLGLRRLNSSLEDAPGLFHN